MSRAFVWGVSAACGACSSGYGDAPGASGGQLTWSFVIPATATQTVLAIVDDTAAGESLQSQVESALEHLDDDARAGSSCTGTLDPAAYHPFDRSLVVVHPSSSGVAAYSSPVDDAALRWQGNQYTDEGHAAWLRAAHSALSANPAERGAPFAALSAVRDSVALLQGSTAPRNDREQALVAAAPLFENSPILIALATEDESPGAAADYPSLDGLNAAGVVPGATPNSSALCMPGGADATTPRYAAWAAFAQRWPCQSPTFFNKLFSECTARCLSHPIAISADGTAQCRAMATYPGSDPCPVELGWLDPLGSDGLRAPRVLHDSTGDSRVCEIKQLEGAALTSCRETLACTDCEPGWCATETAALARNTCPLGSYDPPFRLVLGADHAHPAQVDIVCEEASLP